MTRQVELLVGGTWRVPATAETVLDVNPADTRDVLAEVPLAGRGDLEEVVEAADRGFRRWSRMSPIDRGRILLRAAELIRSRLDAYAADLCRENGKTIREARGEVGRAADFFEYYGGLGRAAQGEVLPDERGGVDVFTFREPLGVVVAITPWNDPMVTPARKLAPALLAGNAVVLKPSSVTPITAENLVRALHDAGIPAGVVNLVTASGSAVTEVLLRHPKVAAVTFTGSTEVGVALRREASERGLKVELEMGGKNAAVVLRGADLERAVEAVVSGAFGQGGQRCTATSRLIVEDEIYRDFLDLLVQKTTSLRVGPGLEESTDVGPMSEERQLEKVLRYIESGRHQGATLLAGGQRIEDGDLRYGYFVAPTIFRDVSEAMDIWQDEIFGPVLAVTRARSLDEAVEIVNRSPYGLSASVFTRDLAAARAFVRAVDVGNVGVNVPTSGWDVHVPFGGFKESGYGGKEHGTEGLHFYTRLKTAAVFF